MILAVDSALHALEKSRLLVVSKVLTDAVSTDKTNKTNFFFFLKSTTAKEMKREGQKRFESFTHKTFIIPSKDSSPSRGKAYTS